jgi:hypothetical protein
MELNPSSDKFDASSSKNFVKFKMARYDNIFYYRFLKFKSMNFLGFSSCTTEDDDGGILITEAILAVVFIKTTLVIITIS